MEIQTKPDLSDGGGDAGADGDSDGDSDTDSDSDSDGDCHTEAGEDCGYLGTIDKVYVARNHVLSPDDPLFGLVRDESADPLSGASLVTRAVNLAAADGEVTSAELC